MAPIPCFLLERSDQLEISLRRFTFSTKTPCPGSSWGHDAEAVIGRLSCLPDVIPNGQSTLGEAMRGDPRWPSACLFCGYEFQPADEWQANSSRLWIRHDTGALYRLNAAPVGAMWNADWYPPKLMPNSPDGWALIVRTPGGDWMVDAPSTNGPGWTRTGRPPKVTARPSIAQPGYHGWLTDGVLHDA